MRVLDVDDEAASEVDADEDASKKDKEGRMTTNKVRLFSSFENCGRVRAISRLRMEMIWRFRGFGSCDLGLMILHNLGLWIFSSVPFPHALSSDATPHPPSSSVSLHVYPYA